MQATEHHIETEEHQSPDPSPVPDRSGPEDLDDGAPDEGDRAELTWDDVFGILSNPRRRAAIRHLNDEAEEIVQLRDLAEQLAAWENDVAVEAVTYKQRKRVYTSLYQSHLPKMDDMDIVRFDKHRGTVEATAWTRELERYLDELETDDGRERSLAGVGVLCLAVVAAGWIGPLSVGVGTLLGIVLGVAITCVAVSAAALLGLR